MEKYMLALASDATVSDAEARLGASDVIFVEVEIDHNAVVALPVEGLRPPSPRRAGPFLLSITSAYFS